MIHEREFPSLDGAATVLADELAESLLLGIRSRGEATLAVSGGRTPRLVFERLRTLELDWSRVTITLTDERWVPPHHPESTEGLVRSHLLVGPPESAHFVPLFGGETSPERGVEACGARLQGVRRPFDAVYLGMGADGHFASLFPGDAAVEVTGGSCVAVPETPERRGRVSLTASTLLCARHVFLLFSGSAKRRAYERARTPGSYSEIPLRLVMSRKQLHVSVLSVDR